MVKLKYFIALLSILFSFAAEAQRKEKPKNYRRYDEKLLHFGFLMGVNTGDFTLQKKSNILEDYETFSVQNNSVPGFQLGIVTSMKLGNPTLRLRFVPSLSFTERILNYSFVNPDDAEEPIIVQERVGSTSVDFPILLKYRTLRYNNFAAYFIGGAQYSLDLQSKAEKAQSFNDPFIKLNQHDIQGQIGGGVDFFLPYFKFGLELKMSHSIGNVLIQDNTTISSPIDRLYNRVWWFSITFEG